MQIVLNGIAKSYGRETVLKGLVLTIASGSRTVVVGANGSGKSTLLQLLAGAALPTTGTVSHRHMSRELPADDVYRHVSIAAPYLNLYAELSLQETIAFHARFKPFRQGTDVISVAHAARLEHVLHKPVQHFSSGMAQRLKLALAILSDTSLLLLDEPASNLDQAGVRWYQELLAAHLDERTLVVASNHQAAEHSLCDQRIEVERYK